MSKSMFRVPFSIKLLVQLAMLVALEIVLNRFLSIRTPIVKIGFAFVPIVICATAHGPIWASLVYIIADVTGTLIEGNVPLPGLTLSCACIGFVFGIFLFELDRSKLSSAKMWTRIVLAVAINQLVFSLVCNSYWLWSAGFIGRDVPYITCVGARVPQTLILTAVQLVLTPALIQIVRILRKQKLLPQHA